MAVDEDYTTLRDFVTRLLEAELDDRTIDRIIGYMARDRWRAACNAIVTGSADISPTALGFAALLGEHCDRTHGVNAAMIGLREILGEEASVAGVHQLTADLSGHAQALKRSYDALLLDLEMGGRQHG